jgi:hypothetical protein
MSADRYTKTVLTVIAVTLVWLCVRDFMPIAHASGAEQNQVSIAASDRDPLPVKIVAIERTVWSEKKGAFETVSRALPWETINVSPQ